ncbi:MAG TPA: EexN family lipoprotein [Woeseiaceae bacterium]|nr:EexN family lipoprotein [Woeseiaceae bacterium]
MTGFRLTLLIAALLQSAACVKEPPARTVTEFVDHPILLEAALLRCTENRAETRYEAECINVREAVKQVEAKEAASRRAELEELSERKRETLRRTQQAAAEARRRARDAEARRKEAEYLAQFGQLPPVENEPTDVLQGNMPTAVLPQAPSETMRRDEYRAPLPPAGSNAPVAGQAELKTPYDSPATRTPQATPDTVREATPGATPQANPAAAPEPDLNAIRDELKRRNEADGES